MSKVHLIKKLFNIQKGLNEPLTREGEGIGYKFLSSDKVVDAIKPLLDKEGIMCNTRVISYEVKEINQMIGAAPVLENTFILNLNFVFTDVETGEEHIVEYAGAGSIGLAKGMASAITSTKKTFYIDFFNIRVNDVEDVENKELVNLNDKLEACKNARELQTLFNGFTKAEKEATKELREKMIDQFKKDSVAKDKEIKKEAADKAAEIRLNKQAAADKLASDKANTDKKGRGRPAAPKK